MLTDEERELLGITKWLKMHHLYMKIARRLSAKEMGFIEVKPSRGTPSPANRPAYRDPGMRIIYGEALFSSKVSKEVKKEIVWAMMELDDLESLQKKLQRS
jgi:hypothetical protein